MATSLSTGPVLGTLSASGSSPVFSTVANQAAVVVVGLSRLASSINPALMRSADGGATWSPVTLTSPGPAFVPAGNGFRSSTFFSVALLDTTSAQYRIDVSFSAGSVFFYAESANVYPAATFRSFQTCNLIEPGDANGSTLSMTTAQLLNLYNLRNTPLTLAQIAAPLTIYKRLDTMTGTPLTFTATAGAVAKLSVPANAMVGFDNSSFSIGINRVVRASSVQVVSVTDANNNSITSGKSFTGDGTGNTATYTAGASINSVDLALGPGSGFPKSSGSFSSSTCFYGIHGFTTLLEAVCAGVVPVSLSAYGL